ncbi:MAG: glycoside hydrolase family 5 protein, partial [Gloeobacteraceae cyanobacterium ES-bin-316]|nr:glycoside hydrolase family 5 protein [Ferruginibacter sp.]
MRRLLLQVCCTCLFVTAYAQPVKEHGKLRVEGIQLVDATNQPMVLNGMSFGWSCFHPRFYTAGAVKE